MKYKIYADIHLGSPIEIKPDGLFNPHQQTKLIGDIVDLASCEKKMVGYYQELWLNLKTIHGKNFIDGNHDRNSVVDELIIENGIVFAHGDLQANPERWTEYRAKSHGAGWFKRTFVVPFIREAEEIIDRKPKKEFLERASALAIKNNCHTYIAGHFHPKQVVETKYNNIRIIIVPRGLTEIDI